MDPKKNKRVLPTPSNKDAKGLTKLAGNAFSQSMVEPSTSASKGVAKKDADKVKQLNVSKSNSFESNH
jgi:hypothetical protein